MKRGLLFFLITCLFQQFMFAQTTKLSNNTSLNVGFSLNGHSIFIQSTNTNIDTLWESDGTAGGTKKIISNVSISGTAGVIFFNNKIFFTGITSASGAELWSSDGTVAGTTLVKI